MGQMYLQRFVYGEGVTKAVLDQAWGEAFKAFAKTGNWGCVDSGVHVVHVTLEPLWDMDRAFEATIAGLK